MNYSPEEIKQYIQEEDVKFIRLMFRDAFGVAKNLSVMPSELDKAFADGIRVNARQIAGFEQGGHDHLYLRPDPSTIAILPWRPESGRVIRMYCDVYISAEKPCDTDTRVLLSRAIEKAKDAGIDFRFGSQSEFYLFKLDEEGNRTEIPQDEAGYMDMAPLDKGENVRREICLTIEEMGLQPERSHHEEGPGQNEIDFHFGDPMTAADQMMTFTMAVATVAGRNGLYADFSPMPIKGKPGNGYHINIYARDAEGNDVCRYAAAGILDKIRDITLFLNPSEGSYRRFGFNTAPDRVNWSDGCESALMRVYPYKGMIRTELRSPDALSNPYLAYAILIEAGLDGIRKRMELPDRRPGERSAGDAESKKSHGRSGQDLMTQSVKREMAAEDMLLPQSLKEAVDVASHSEFVSSVVPERILKTYFSKVDSI